MAEIQTAARFLGRTAGMGGPGGMPSIFRHIYHIWRVLNLTIFSMFLAVTR